MYRVHWKGNNSEISAHGLYQSVGGVQWLSGRVLDSGSRASLEALEALLVSLSKTLDPLLSTGSTQEDPS